MGRRGILAEPVSASTFKGKFTERKEEMFQKAQDEIAKFPSPLTLGAHVVLVKSPPTSLEALDSAPYGHCPLASGGRFCQHSSS